MRYYEAVEYVANLVYNSLNIPEDIYKTFDLATAEDFKAQYLDNTSYLRSMVADELFSLVIDVEPAEQSDLIDDIVLQVSDKIEENLKKYAVYQHEVTLFEFERIIQSILSCATELGSDIEDVSVEDYSEFDNERDVTITLSNGATIHMDVRFEEDYDDI